MVGGFSAKNVGKIDSGSGGETGRGAGLWGRLEEKDRQILGLERQMVAEREADRSVIEMLREENEVLRGTLEGLMDSGAGAGHTGESRRGGKMAESVEGNGLSEAFEEIATLRGRVAELEAELAESRLDLSAALEAAEKSEERVANYVALLEVEGGQSVILLNKPPAAAAVPEERHERSDEVDGRLRSILAYP